MQFEVVHAGRQAGCAHTGQALTVSLNLVSGAAALLSYCSQCSHNARCVPTLDLDPNLDPANRLQSNTRCSCDHIDCEGVLQKPMCGSDGRDYLGACQMMLEACHQQKSIHKLYYGRCRSSGKGEL